MKCPTCQHPEHWPKVCGWPEEDVAGGGACGCVPDIHRPDPMTPTPPLTARIVVVEPDEWETGLAAILNSLRPHLSENLWVDASCSIEAVLREALAAVRAEADGLRAAIPADPWVWLVRREGHARCYACDTPWSEAEAHAPDCAWLAATTPEGGA